MNNQTNIQAKRIELKQISNTLKELKENGGIKTINEGLLSIYNLQGHSQLKTFEQWKALGKSVKKGSKAFYLWGKQVSREITENGECKEVKFFPLIALFSENQVYTPNF